MRRITYWALSTVSVLVLLFGYHTSLSGPRSAATSLVAPISGATSSSGAQTSGAGSSPPDDTGSSGTGSSGSGSSGSGSSGSGSPASGSGSTSTSSTVTGDVAETRWGPVQVEVTITGSKLTNVSVIQYPNGNGRDLEINSYALPQLIQETLDAQSANIDMISGATITSDGYLQSLQSALDHANL